MRYSGDMANTEEQWKLEGRSVVQEEFDQTLGNAQEYRCGESLKLKRSSIKVYERKGRELLDACFMI